MLIVGIVATVVGIFILDIVATVRVVQSGAYSKSQKLLQVSIIWAVPLAGAAIALLVISSDLMTVERRRTSDPSDINAYAAGYGDAEASHDHSAGRHGGDIGGGGLAG
jgi:hypothetical protein